MNREKNNLQEVALTVIKTAGIISLALFAPNALRILKDFNIIKDERRQKSSLQRSLHTLIKNGFVKKHTNQSIVLTKKGEKYLNLLKIKSFSFEKPKTWDRRWRILIFDIPEKRKSTRSQVRNILREAGFMYLQDSVWIFPYDCKKYIELIKTLLYLQKHLIYITADEIENDTRLKKYFYLN